MAKKVLFLLTSLLISQFLFSQKLQNRCGTDLLDAYFKDKVPQYASYRLEQKKRIRDYSNIHKSAGTIRIPVVVHVIYRLDEQNISDTQIQSQIDVMNRDFNKKNWDTLKVPSVWKNLIADCGIEFILANRDPNGNITNGITKKATTIKDIASIGGDLHYQSSKGGQDIWDRDQYLNIWVCEISGGVYGFSSLPGAPAESDGLVIAFSSFGTEGTATFPTDKGRTTTHEIGHWFNLYHLWGLNQCGDDFINDTPEQLQGNYDCKTYPYNTTCNSTADGEMFMNFMDYSDDNCLNMFTIGQKDVMIATINTDRFTLLTSGGYNGVNSIEKKDFKIYPTPASEYINIELDSDLELNRIEVFNVNGLKVSELDIPQPRSDQSVFVGQLNDGMYFLILFTNQGLFTEKVLVWHH